MKIKMLPDVLEHCLPFLMSKKFWAELNQKSPFRTHNLEFKSKIFAITSRGTD